MFVLSNRVAEILDITPQLASVRLHLAKKQSNTAYYKEVDGITFVDIDVAYSTKSTPEHIINEIQQMLFKLEENGVNNHALAKRLVTRLDDNRSFDTIYVYLRQFSFAKSRLAIPLYLALKEIVSELSLD